MLELPIFSPGIHFGSVYLGYARQSPRPRPQGYSTLAPPAADTWARAHRGLSCGVGTVPNGIDWIVIHRGLYAQSGFFAAGVRGARGGGSRRGRLGAGRTRRRAHDLATLLQLAGDAGRAERPLAPGIEATRIPRRPRTVEIATCDHLAGPQHEPDPLGIEKKPRLDERIAVNRK